jgi:hypothetical protein
VFISGIFYLIFLDCIDSSSPNPRKAKSQISGTTVDSFYTVGHMVSVTAAQLCHSGTKIAVDHRQRNENGWFPIKLYLQSWVSWIWPLGYNLPTLVCDMPLDGGLACLEIVLKISAHSHHECPRRADRWGGPVEYPSNPQILASVLAVLTELTGKLLSLGWKLFRGKIPPSCSLAGCLTFGLHFTFVG